MIPKNDTKKFFALKKVSGFRGGEVRHIFARGHKKAEIIEDYTWYIKEPQRILERRDKFGFVR